MGAPDSRGKTFNRSKGNCSRLFPNSSFNPTVRATGLDSQVDFRNTPPSTCSMSNSSSQSTPVGFLLAGVPHAEALKLHVMSLEAGKVICKVPYAEHLIGNPDTRVIHGGVITSLLDNACGIAVGSRTALRGQIATLDLRIDYMKAATPGEDILAFAECFKVTRNIAFTRGIAYHTDKDDPIATCAAAFMLKTKTAPSIRSNAPGDR